MARDNGSAQITIRKHSLETGARQGDLSVEASEMAFNGRNTKKICVSLEP